MSRKPKLAFFTPLNPLRSGVSDYSEELLPYLAEHAEVDVFIDDYSPSNTALSHTVNLLPVDAFRARSSRYDEVIYQVANNLQQHGYMLPYIGEFPGVLVLHDYCLQYLTLGATAFVGNLKALEQLLSREHGPRARQVSRRLVLSLMDPYELSFAGPLIEASKGVIVHSRFAQSRVLRDFPQRVTEVVSMGIARSTCSSPEVDGARDLGIEPGDFVIASISTLTYTKRLHLVLEAMLLLPEHCNVKLVVVGAGPVGRRVRKLLQNPWLKQRVVRTGWVSAADYQSLIASAGAVVDLRYPTGAETSASLLRAMAAGVPAILSDHGSFSEIPDSCCVRVPVDGKEPARVAALISRLMLEPDLQKSLSRGASAYVERFHGLQRCASSYIESIARISTVHQPASGQVFGVERSPMKGKIISTTYKLFRAIDLYRKYGLADTLERVRAELHIGTQRRRE